MPSRQAPAAPRDVRALPAERRVGAPSHERGSVSEDKEALEQPYFSVALRFGTGKKKEQDVAMLHLVSPTFITPLMLQARSEAFANFFRNLADMGLTERDLHTEFLIGIQSGSADRETLKATITSSWLPNPKLQVRSS